MTEMSKTFRVSICQLAANGSIEKSNAVDTLQWRFASLRIQVKGIKLRRIGLMK